MEWVETTGRTIEDAKEAALDQLGIDESDAEFEVLEEPKTGLFGRPRGEARIRARVVPKAPRPKQERRPRRGLQRWQCPHQTLARWPIIACLSGRPQRGQGSPPRP